MRQIATFVTLMTRAEHLFLNHSELRTELNAADSMDPQWYLIDIIITYESKHNF